MSNQHPKDLLKQTANSLSGNTAEKTEILGYLIDASISDCPNLEETFDEIISKGQRLIITSISLEELDKLQHSEISQEAAKGARYILRKAAENENKAFDVVLINRDYNISDDSILKYCIDNKGIGLITSNKVMALKARAFSIECLYLSKHETDEEKRKLEKNIKTTPNPETKQDSSSEEQLIDLPGCEYYEDSLWITSGVAGKNFYQLIVDGGAKRFNEKFPVCVGNHVMEIKHIKENLWNISKYIVKRNAPNCNSLKVYSEDVKLLDNKTFEALSSKEANSYLGVFETILKKNNIVSPQKRD